MRGKWPMWSPEVSRRAPVVSRVSRLLDTNIGNENPAAATAEVQMLTSASYHFFSDHPYLIFASLEYFVNTKISKHNIGPLMRPNLDFYFG